MAVIGSEGWSQGLAFVLSFVSYDFFISILDRRSLAEILILWW